MDSIAASASVSKQIVYKHFAEDSLFTELVTDTVERVEARIEAASRVLGGREDLERELTDLAQSLVDSSGSRGAGRASPDRREAPRFPELGRSYYERGFRRGLQSLAAGFAELAGQGRLEIDDPDAAADHFAGMVLWHPANQAMFCGPGNGPSKREARRYAQAGARAFLAAYGPRTR